MSAPSTISSTPAAQAPPKPEADQRVFLRGLRWEDFEQILAIKGDAPVPRLTYLEGVLELMSPSREHERIKTTLGRLVEAWSEEVGIDLTGFGSWTIKKQDVDRGAEPDECYIIGVEEKPHPDLAIEVIWTSGGIDKLEVYRLLGVREVWLWKGGAITPYELADDQYQPRPGSVLFPDMDLARLAEFAVMPKQPVAVRQYRAWLREQTG